MGATKIAETADVDEYAVAVTLSEGSVKVDATIDMEGRIGLMEAENEGTGVNLVTAMEAIKNGVQAQVGSSDTAAAILETANEVEGVKEAAEGEITSSEPDEARVQVDASVHANAFASLVIGAVAAA